MQDIETNLQKLRLLKCDEFQGYLFSRPVLAEQIKILLQENKSPPKSQS